MIPGDAGHTERPMAKHCGHDYHTPVDVPVPWAVRLFGWTRVTFYVALAREVWGARQAVRKGLFARQDFAERGWNTIRLCESFGARYHVTGLQHVAALEQPVVIVGNHMSSLETFVLSAFVLPHRSMTFVVKESLVRMPLFGEVLASQKPICVGRSKPREDLRTVLREGKQRLADGTSVCVFPQSTRTADFTESRFNSIGAKLAFRAGVPVLPLALRTDFWGNGVGVLKDFGPVGRHRDVHFAFGPVIPAGTTSRDTHRRVVRFVRDHLQRWGVSCSPD